MPCRLAISSHSLGRAWHHSFAHKMAMARKHNITGIEIFYEDLEHLARSLPGGLTAQNQLAAAHIMRDICAENSIEIICLQPFMHYEGLRDRLRHKERIEEMKLWIRLAKALGTEIIAIPSSFLSRDEISGDIDLIVQDMREVADLGAQENPVMRFCYESLAWGTYSSTWEQSWEVVQRVDRSNFGLVLDTFNIAARIYADPTALDGKTPDAEKAVHESMERLVRMVNVKKLFLIQVVDAERLNSPLIEGHKFFVEGQPARMSWSRNCRLFYGERDFGAYLPILEISKAIFEGLGYEGWVSAELFNRCMAFEDPGVPEMLASRCALSWRQLVKDCGLEKRVVSKTANKIEGIVKEVHMPRLEVHL